MVEYLKKKKHSCLYIAQSKTGRRHNNCRYHSVPGLGWLCYEIAKVDKRQHRLPCHTVNRSSRLRCSTCENGSMQSKSSYHKQEDLLHDLQHTLINTFAVLINKVTESNSSTTTTLSARDNTQVACRRIYLHRNGASLYKTKRLCSSPLLII